MTDAARASATTPTAPEAFPQSRGPGFLGAVVQRIRMFGLLIVLAGIWQFVSTRVLDASTATLLPPPSAIVIGAWELIETGELFRHLRDSVKRELVAFIFAVSAIPLGIAMGWSRVINEQFDVLIEVLRPIPPLAWIPLSILWFGIGDTQNQFIIFLGMFFPILLNTITGVKNIEPNLVHAAQCLGASELKILWRVVLRAALPSIVTGIRVGLGVGWMALVAAELVGANSGLGFLINDARTVLRTDYVIVGMMTIGVVGLFIDRGVRALGRWAMPWSRAMAQ